MKRVLPHVGVALGALLTLSAQAKEGDTFRPFASFARYYDSNLLRLADGESVFENGALNTSPQRSDQYSVLSAGLNVDWKPGRQQIIASATKTRVRFDHYARYDNDGYDYRATWNWRLGNRLSGNAGATETLSQSSFSNVGQVNNLVTHKRYFGRGEWEFHPRWRIGASIDEADYSNSEPSQASQNVNQQARDVVLSYNTPKGSRLRAQVRRIDAEYPNAQIISVNTVCSAFPLPLCPPLPFYSYASEVADNSYKQTEYNLLGDWNVSGKLNLHGQAGWVDRQYLNVLRGTYSFFVPQLKERPNFSGFAGRLSGDWYATGKTLLSFSVYQELGGAQDINASSVLKKGASLNGVWLIREKWRMNAGATFENRDFKGDPGTTQTQRNDDTVNATLSISYAPIEAVSIDFGLMAGRRDSNMVVEDYRYHSVFANVRADF